jgi:spore coat protein H
MCLAGVLGAAENAPPATPAQLFDASRLWTVHLTFTQEQWDSMEPKGGGPPGMMMGPGGPPGGPPRVAVRLGPGPGGRGGPGFLMVPAFLSGDRDKDGKLSREEFRALGEEWFAAWDKQKAGRLNEEQIAAGLGGSMGRGGMPGPPPGGGRGPGNFGIDFPWVHASVDFNGTALRNVAVRYKGNSTFMSSRNSLKRSMKIDLNKHVKGQKLAGVTRINLHSNVMDAGWMNEPIGYRLFRDGGVAAPRTSYARVYLTIPGKYDKQYVGLYSVVEEVDNNFAQERFGTKEGAIFKPETQSLFAYLGDDWSKYGTQYDPKTDLTAKQQQRVIDFARLVTSAPDAEFQKALPEYLDIDEFARYFAINAWQSNMDSIFAMGHNFYLYLPADGKFRMLPWDLDLSFGGMGGGTELSISRPWRGQNRFLERLYANEAFQKAYRAYLAEFNGTIFAADRLSKQVDEAAKVIRAAVEEESAEKLTRFDKTVAGEPAGPGPGFGGPRPGMGPGGPGGPPGGRGGPGGSPIKAFAGPRAKSVAEQLAGRSSGQDTGFGFPGPGGRGGFNPGRMFGATFLRAVDGNGDGAVTRDEFAAAFSKWFDTWGGKDGPLTEEQVRAGIERDLSPPMPPMPPMQ